MCYHTAVEDIETDHWVAWVLGLLGCFSSARTQDEAVERVPGRIAEYALWRNAHGRPLAGGDRPESAVEIEVVEVFRAFNGAEDYVVNAFLADDRRPLGEADVEEGRWLLACTRKDLLEVVRQVAIPVPERVSGDAQRYTTKEILRHIAGAERWYFERLGFEQEPLDSNTLQALERVRTNSLR